MGSCPDTDIDPMRLYEKLYKDDQFVDLLSYEQFSIGI